MIAFLVLLAAMGVMAYAGNQLIKTDQMYREGDTVYESLSEKVRSGVKADGLPPQENTGAGGLDKEGPDTALVFIPDAGINYETLKAISGNTAAWLYCPNTVIDYPVMKADDYSYYLSHLPDGTQNANGSLFIDYNTPADFSGRLTVIYGHNMKSKKMFGSLTGYRNQEYYEEHPVMYLYTEKGDYRIELIYGFVIGAGQWRARAFMYGVNTGELLNYAAHHTTFESGVQYEDGDRIAALSTCSYEFDDARYVVLGVLREPV